jgi:hypothetical protein
MARILMPLPGSLPPHPRWIALVSALAGLLLVVSFESEALRYRSAAVFGSLLLILGVGGLVDPRLLWAIGPRRAEFPGWVRLVGALLAAIGIGLGIALVLRADGWVAF